MILSVLVKQKFFRIAEIVHLRIFGHEMGEEMRKFLGNLSWSFFGGIIAAGIMFSVNIIAGRWLGPEEYGRYNLTLATASFFIIFLLFGLDVSATRFMSLAENDTEKIKIAKFIFKRVIFSSLAVFSFIFFLSTFDLAATFLDFNILFVSLIFAFFLSLRSIADSYLRGFNFFHFQSKTRLIESFVVLSLVIAFSFFSDNHALYLYLSAVIFGYFIFSLIVLRRLKILLLVFDSRNEKKFKHILKYGSYATIGTVASFFLVGSDKLLVGHSLGEENLGLYSAYFNISILPVTLLQAIAVNVFFPAASASKNKKNILQKMNKIFLFLFFPVLLVLFLIIFLAIKLFGEQYSSDVMLSVLFSIYATLYFFVGLRQWFLASISDNSILHSSIVAILAGITQFLITFFLLVVTSSLAVFVSGIIVSYCLFIFLNHYFICKLLKEDLICQK